MDINKVLKEKREEILRTARRYGAANVRIFGSVARGEADLNSDLDLLVAGFESNLRVLNERADARHRLID